MFSYCLCPSSLDNVEGNLIFPFFFTRFSSDANKLILDNKNVLMYKYAEKCKENEIFDFITWEKMLYLHDTVVSCEVDDYDSLYDFVFNLTKNVFTTNCKTIVSSDDGEYSKYLDDIKRENIVVSTLKDAAINVYPSPSRRVEEKKLCDDLVWCIQSLPDRHIFKGATEDEYNDQIRDLLLAKDYMVLDQTRRGVSLSGYKSGEVDLLIKEGSNPFAIYEGLILDSVKKTYIKEHLLKSLVNYDSIGLRVSFLVVYYNGNNFADFCVRYKSYMDELLVSSLNERVSLKFISEKETKFSAIRIFILNGTKDGKSFTNYQILVKVN
ncbi:hypothetical protein [Shewanella xiamenensis]|uniref:hypothetical protein n=1 Tax=Shewanella xiamenensis TaxID=332186 RepID=UPI00313E4BFF